jgi:hypothetical protein
VAKFDLIEIEGTVGSHAQRNGHLFYLGQRLVCQRRRDGQKVVMAALLLNTNKR